MRATTNQTAVTPVVGWDGPPVPVENRRAAHLAARCNLVALPILVIFTIPALMAAMIALTPAPAKGPWADEAARLGVQPVDIFWGQATFSGTCAACHGQDGRGVPHLGKPLRNSAFVQGATDDELFALVTHGRPAGAPENTTGVPMPARGGNAQLSDERIRDVVLYLRTLQDPDAPVASLENWRRPVLPAPDAQRASASDVSASGERPAGAGGPGGDASAHGTPAFDPAGRDAFVASCSACHGADAMGLPGLGKPLRTSAFVASKTDDELLTFVKTGRPTWNPENTTGVDMPPKGGNPALSDDQLKLIIAYLRAIHTDGADAQSGAN